MNFKLFRSKELASSQSIKVVFLKADKHSSLFFISRAKLNDSIQSYHSQPCSKAEGPSLQLVSFTAEHCLDMMTQIR